MSVIMANQTGHEERQETPFWVREAIPRPPPAGRATGQHGGGVGGWTGGSPSPRRSEAVEMAGRGRVRAGRRVRAMPGRRARRRGRRAVPPAASRRRGFRSLHPLARRASSLAGRPRAPSSGAAWGPHVRPPDALRAAACTRCASWTSAREETRPGRADRARLCPPGAEASPGGT